MLQRPIMEPSHRCRFLIFPLALLSLFFSCSPVERKVNRSYYFWRNSDYISHDEKDFLRQHQINRLYYKILDVDWNETNHAYPVSINYPERFNANIYPQDSLNMEIIPVVFITNKVFDRITRVEMPELVKKVLRKCFTKYDDIDSTAEAATPFYMVNRIPLFNPAEIQFDCDWTVSTAQTYFSFLEQVKNELRQRKTKISATIRLHQYKYPEKTGVPPVDKGMLMVYNISDATKYGTTNSIFDKELAAKYFTRNKKYNLPMDIALAAYSWGIIYRNKKFFQVENYIDEEDIRECSFLKSTGNNMYTVTVDTVYGTYNLYLRAGDEIKLEKVDEATLLDAAQLARKAMNSDSLNISLFELSSNEIKNYRYETIEQVYNHFK